MAGQAQTSWISPLTYLLRSSSVSTRCLDLLVTRFVFRSSFLCFQSPCNAQSGTGRHTKSARLWNVSRDQGSCALHMDKVYRKPPVFPLEIVNPASSRWYVALLNYWKECNMRLVYNNPNEIFVPPIRVPLSFFTLSTRRSQGLWKPIYATPEKVIGPGTFRRAVLLVKHEEIPRET